MGTPKHELPFGPETMLARIARLLSEVCSPLVVVSGAETPLPELAGDVRFVRDQRPDRGPLEGLHAGLSALAESVDGGQIDAAYVTGCDVPLLAPAFVRRMFELLGEHSIAVPQSAGFLHPLSAVYRLSVVDVIAELLARDRLKPTLLFDIVSTRRVDERELLDVDPRLDTLRNLNEPADYQAALALAGFGI